MLPQGMLDSIAENTDTEVCQVAFWLMKSEPDAYSIDDLARDGREPWDGIRNYQARNIMRDRMKLGDLVFVYHSVVTPQVIAGIARVSREAYPDHHARDPESPYYDPRARADDPRWVMVDLHAVRGLEPPVTRDELKACGELEHMMLLKKGSRLSVQPVTAAEWAAVLALRGLNPESME